MTRINFQFTVSQAMKIDEALSQYLGEEAQAAPAEEGTNLSILPLQLSRLIQETTN